MRTLVCFKTTPIWERVLDSDWDRFSEHTDLAYAGKQLGCFDEAALELGLRLKDMLQKQGREASCDAVTVGTQPASFAQTLFAAGYDNVTALGTEPVEFSPAAVAAALAGYAAQGGYDLIFTGKVAGMADTGLVPLLLAQALSLPLVQDALDVRPCQGGVAVRCQEPDGVWERRVRAPLMISVGNSPAVLRAVTLRARLAVKHREARTLPADIRADGVAERQFSRPVSKRDCTFLSGSMAGLADKLISRLNAPLPKGGIQSKGLTGGFSHISARRCTPPPSPEGGMVYPPNTVVYDTSTVPWHGVTEALPCLVSNWREHRPDYALLPDTSLGRQLAAGLAAAVNGSSLTGTSVTANGAVSKRVCASNLVWTQRPSLPAVLTMAQLPPDAERVSISADGSSPPAWLLGEEKVAPASKTGLNHPHLVVICGAGMGSREGCEKARALAGRLHAGFGLTRMAALSGWGVPDEIVGQSGASIAPAVCLVLGASGASAFWVGVENAGRVIAVNTDKNALIFKNADVGVAADAPTLAAALLERMESR